MHLDQRHGGFHLVINSIEDFAILCVIIRSEDFTDNTLSDLANKLHAATAGLTAAEQADKAPTS